jgi:hypothetical protein
MKKYFDLLRNEAPTEQQKIEQIFEQRCTEYWNIVQMSYSSEMHNSCTITYDGLNPSTETSLYRCPLRLEKGALKNWLDYSPRVQEAIRQGCRVGIGRLFLWNFSGDYEKWHYIRDVNEPDLRTNLLVLKQEVIRTQKFEIGIEALDDRLKRVYDQASTVPYHPLFDRRFITLSAATPLHEIENFLSAQCLQHDLMSTEGLKYLIYLLIDGKAAGHIHSAAFEIASKWLNDNEAALSIEAVELRQNVRPKLNDLCCNGFTVSYLSELLRILGVIDQNNRCLTNKLKGKAQGRRSRFTAAYRVLRRADLLSANIEDSDWTIVFEEEYGVILGPAVASHSLEKNGLPRTDTSLEFKDGVEIAKDWVQEWKQKRAVLPPKQS